MFDQVLVRSEDVEFYVQTKNIGGIEPAGFADGAYSFEDVEKTIRAIGSTVVRAWDTVKPSEASVEFNLQLTAKSGKITGLLVEGESEASLKVTMTWKPGSE